MAETKLIMRSLLPFLFGDKPKSVPQSDWDRIQQTTRTAEAKIGKASYGWLRSDKEKQQLLTASISLSDSELDFYVGCF